MEPELDLDVAAPSSPAPRRLRLTTGLVAGGAALAVVAALAVAANRRAAPETRTTPTPPTSELPAETYFGPALSVGPPAVTPLDLPGEVYDLGFGDAAHGAAIAQRCATQFQLCELTLAVTTDGKTWQRRPLPFGALQPPNHMPALHVLGGGSLVVIGYDRWHSRDAGRTWQRVSAVAGTPVSDARGGQLLLDVQAGLVVLRRDTGTLAPLAHPPDLIPTWAAPAPEHRRGMWWIGGRDAAGRKAVAESADLGRSWRVTPLPGALGAGRVQVVGASSEPREEYAVVTDDGGQLQRIYARAGDGWQVRWPGGGGRRLVLTGDPIVHPDGVLVLNINSRVWGSTDEGRSFTMMTGHAIEYVRLTPAWWIGRTTTGSWLQTGDGLTWGTLAVM